MAVNQNQSEATSLAKHFCLRTTENFQTRTENKQESCHSQVRKEDDEKREKPSPWPSALTHRPWAPNLERLK